MGWVGKPEHGKTALADVGVGEAVKAEVGVDYACRSAGDMRMPPM